MSGAAKDKLSEMVKRLSAANDAILDELSRKQRDVWEDIEALQKRIGLRAANQAETAEMKGHFDELRILGEARTDMLATELQNLKTIDSVAEAVAGISAVRKNIAASVKVAGTSARRIKRAGEIVAKVDGLLKILFAAALV